VTAAQEELNRLQTVRTELTLTLQALGPTHPLYRELSQELDQVEAKLKFYRKLAA
jgi:hypothetical protein